MKTEKKSKSKVRKILEWIFTIIVSTLFIIVLIGQIQGMVTRNDNYGQSLPYGYGNFIVLTDSMEPFYKVDSAIITHKDNVEEIYSLYLEQAKYNAVLDKDDGENLDQKLLDKMDEIKVYLRKLSLATFNDEVLDKKEKEVKAMEDENTKTELLSALTSLRTARGEYYSLEEKYQHIDITFMDAYSSSYPRANEIPQLNDASGTPKYNDRTSPSNMVMTHRLRYIAKDENSSDNDVKYLFYVSGTNLSTHYAQAGQYQVFSEKELLGVVKINSPVLGGFFSFVSSIWGLLVLILIPALYLIITSGIDMIRGLKEQENEEELLLANAKPNSLEGISLDDQERLKAEMLEEILYGKKTPSASEAKKEKKEESSPLLDDISLDDQERLKAEMLAEMMKEKKVEEDNSPLKDISKEDQERLKAEMLAEMMKNQK